MALSGLYKCPLESFIYAYLGPFSSSLSTLLLKMQKGTDLGMFRQLDEILYVEGYPGYLHLMSMAVDSMQLVCEVKGNSPVTAFSNYNNVVFLQQ